MFRHRIFLGAARGGLGALRAKLIIISGVRKPDRPSIRPCWLRFAQHECEAVSPRIVFSDLLSSGETTAARSTPAANTSRRAGWGGRRGEGEGAKGAATLQAPELYTVSRSGVLYFTTVKLARSLTA